MTKTTDHFGLVAALRKKHLAQATLTQFRENKREREREQDYREANKIAKITIHPIFFLLLLVMSIVSVQMEIFNLCLKVTTKQAGAKNSSHRFLPRTREKQPLQFSDEDLK